MKYLLTFPLLSATALCLCVYIVSVCALVRLDGRGVLSVAVLDVGQGDAIFIETPHGRQILIDGGSSAKVLAQLRSQMSFFDHTIDVLMVTNPDKDHIGGFIDVLRRYDVSLVLEPGTVSDSATYAQLERLVVAEGSRRVLARRGMDIVLDEGVHLLVLFPDTDPSALSTNDGSIVAKLVYGSTTMMLTGDAPEKTEKHLVGLDADMLDSDILKVGHHGSKTSTSDEFLQAVSPMYAVISAGKKNSYGHPSPIVVDRLRSFGVQVFGTYAEGRIVFESDGLQWAKK